MAITDAPKCQHTQKDGSRCQRPARSRLRLCDFHHREHKRNAKRTAERARQSWFERVALDDPRSIQRALWRVIQHILHGEIGHHRAGQLLYKLQMATLDLQVGKSETGKNGTAKNGESVGKKSDSSGGALILAGRDSA
jgi:hypothetical protein